MKLPIWNCPNHRQREEKNRIQKQGAPKIF